MNKSIPLLILLLFLSGDRFTGHRYEESWVLMKRTGKVEAYVEYYTGAKKLIIEGMEVML